MIRMLISLKEKEKQWLMKTAKKENMSTAELIRRAISLYRTQHQQSKRHNIQRLLKKTKGTWTHGDGLEYQRKLRDEWE